jgi:hypothetical protein
MWLVEYILWLATTAGSAILASRLYYTKLYRIYPWLFAYLLVRFVRSLVLLHLSPTQTAYAAVWLYTEPVLWLLYVLIVLELCSLVLNKFPGIASASHWAVTGALGISIVISLFTLTADLSMPIVKYPVIVYFNVIRRGLYSSLVLFLLLLILFLRWYPVPLSRNLVTHTIVFAVYFTSYAAGLLVRNLLGFEVTRTFSTVQEAISLLCLGSWLIFLRASGEELKLKLRPTLGEFDEQRILKHLDSLNASLLRIERK